MPTVVIGAQPGVVASGYKKPPSPIPTTGMTAWFDAADAGSFTFGTGSTVAEWRSKVPTVKLAQTIDSFRPSRSGTMNGLPTVTFNGHVLHGSPWPGVYQPETFFIVFKTKAAVGATPFVLTGFGRYGPSLGRVLKIKPDQKMSIDYYYTTFDTNASVVPNTPTLWCYTYDVPVHQTTGPGYSLYVNGQLDKAAPSNYGTDNTGGIMELGATYYDSPTWNNEYFPGDIAEIIQYNRVLSESERLQVQEYLDQKWNLIPAPFPLTIPWHSAFWASDPKWSKPADGGAVPSWRNAGTSGVAAVQATSTAQPTYRASYAALNGKPAIEFDGVNDWLQGATPSIAQPNHMFMVGWLDPTAPVAATVFSGAAAEMLRAYSASGYFGMYAGGAWVNMTGSLKFGAISTASLFNGATSELRVNGTNHAVTATPGANPLTSLSIGADAAGGGPWKGAIAFLGVCDRALTAAEIEDLENWARAFYGVPVTPPIPTTGLQGWWDADDDNVFTYSSGTNVSQWNDKSGKGNHVSQATVSAQPNRTGTINGRSGLYFNGVSTPQGLSRAATRLVNATTGEWSVFTVVRRATNGGGNIIDQDGATRVAQFLRYGYAGDAIEAIAFNTGGTPFVESMAPASATTAQVWGATCGPTALETWVNGASNGPLAITGPLRTDAPTMSIGSTNNLAGGLWTGDIAEVIVYDRVLSAAERNQVQGYLQTKWAIAPLTVKGGTVTTFGGYEYHAFSASGTLDVLTAVDADYILISGGGGGGAHYGGGGGGAGIVTGTATLSPGATAVTVGVGGAGAVYNGATSGDGTASSLGGVSTTGGGGGGGGRAPALPGRNGATGGGGGNSSPVQTPPGTGIAGQGFDGGPGTDGPPLINGGGGGGAGGAGGWDGMPVGIAPGKGVRWVNGAVYGWGGLGALNAYSVQNTGKYSLRGAGGAGGVNGGNGTVGDSGLVIVRVPGAPIPSSQAIGLGGTIVDDGGYRYHIFSASGTFTATQAGRVEVMLISGGGGGGYHFAGGGGGGMCETFTNVGVRGDTAVVVGAGGAGGQPGPACGRGGNLSSFGPIESMMGGGGGGARDTNVPWGGNGACGGGGANLNGGIYSIQKGKGLFGNHGGDGIDTASMAGGGGGGLGSAGGDAQEGPIAGTAGAGVPSPWIPATIGTICAGGVGATSAATPAPLSTTVGQGGGAGGAGHEGAAGGNGLVVVRYLL